MGKAARPKPRRLAEKLVEIRQRLNLSQNEMIRHLGFDDELTQAEISAFERGVREPHLLLLLRYARVTGLCTDDLIDDKINLPKRLPIKRKHSH